MTFPCPSARIEDGFLRSRGLGAELVPPLSLVTDDLGIYYRSVARKPPGPPDRRTVHRRGARRGPSGWWRGSWRRG